MIYATAGRSSYLDSGIDLCRIDPQAGTLLSRAPIYSPDTQTGRQPEQYDANTMPGSRSDILSDDADHVYLQESAFDGRQLIRQDGNPHLFALTGMLDDAWSHRARASPGDAADRQPVVPCRRTGPGTRAAKRSGLPRESDTGVLLAVSTADGRVQSQLALNRSPVFDGLAAAEGRLFLAQEGGQVVCLEGAGATRRGNEVRAQGHDSRADSIAVNAKHE